MTEHNDQTDAEPAEQENEHWIKHVDTVPIRIKRETESNGYSHVVHLTKAVRQVADQTGTPISDVVDSDIEFRNDMYDEDEGTLPAPVYLNQPASGGKGRETWRTFISSGKRQDGTPSSITLRVPDSSIETLGFEPETCEGHLVEVWVADDLLAFSRPQQGVFNIKIPRDVVEEFEETDKLKQAIGDVDGIGEYKIANLLHYFGDSKSVLEATPEELGFVTGVGPTTAKKIHEHIKRNGKENVTHAE